MVKPSHIITQTKKKVVIFSPIFNIDKLGGSERTLYDLSQLLASHNMDVTIITSSLSGYHYYQNVFSSRMTIKKRESNAVKVEVLPTNNILNLFFYIFSQMNNSYLSSLFPQGIFFYKKDVFSLLKKIKPDCIYSSILPYYHNELIASMSNKLSLKQFIVCPEMHWDQKIYLHKKNMKVLTSTTILQVFTQSEKIILSKIFGIDKKRIVIIPPLLKHIHINAFKINILKNTLKGRKIVLFIGKKCKEKGTIELLKTIQLLWKDDPSYLLIAAGETSLEWRIYKHLYNGPHLMDFDWISEEYKQQLFSISDIFCMPSVVESFGLVYLEAWQWKKPVIAYESPAAKEMIKDSLSGLTIKKVSVNAIKEAIQELMNNKTKAKMYGLNGYNQLMRKYTYCKKIENKYLKLFTL